VGERGVEEIAGAERADDLGVLPVRGDGLHHEAELVCRYIAPRLRGAHDAVAPVDVVVELVARARRAPALLHLRTRPADHRVDVADRVRIANSRDGHRALADLAGTFQLDVIDRIAPELEAADSCGALAALLVATMRHVEQAARDVLEERAGTLVHRVARH